MEQRNDPAPAVEGARAGGRARAGRGGGRIRTYGGRLTWRRAPDSALPFVCRYVGKIPLDVKDDEALEFLRRIEAVRLEALGLASEAGTPGRRRA